jgi:hypothetical protein
MTDKSESFIGTIPNDYSHYDRLDGSKKQIRLLQVRPSAEPDDKLVCVLTRTSLTDCPPYQALSYVWGSLEDTIEMDLVILDDTEVTSTYFQSPEDMPNSAVEKANSPRSARDVPSSLTSSHVMGGLGGMVMLDLVIRCPVPANRAVIKGPTVSSNVMKGESPSTLALRASKADVITDFKITRNLHTALKSLRAQNDGLFFWADMLCINQGDIVERAHQVSLMKEIYTQASSVLVCLGDDPEMRVDRLSVEEADLALFWMILEDKGWEQPVNWLRVLLQMQRERDNASIQDKHYHSRTTAHQLSS